MKMRASEFVVSRRKWSGSWFLYIATCLYGTSSILVGASAGAISSSSSSNCESIAVRMCSKMSYNQTTLPNFFGDETQEQAIERSQIYNQLVTWKCSAHIRDYLCELLAPVCLDTPGYKDFKVYPCRPFCQQILSECQSEIKELARKFSEHDSERLFMQAFECSELPFERNGGNASLAGPCHEMAPPAPSRSPQPAQQPPPARQPPSPFDEEPFLPYDPSLPSLPPAQDTSRLELPTFSPNPFPRLPGAELDPSPPPSKRPDRDNRFGAGGFQERPLLESLRLLLLKNSNLLSLLTIIILIVVLVFNSERLTRFKNYLTLSASSSSESASSSAGSTKHHFSSPLIAGYPPISSCSVGGLANKNGAQVSPSSSSRSLVLFAGSHKQPASHKLIPSQLAENLKTSTVPSQKLFEELNSRKTRIHLNGSHADQQPVNRTLLRDDRYHLMMSAQSGSSSAGSPGGSVRHGRQLYLQQSGDKQQLFNTLDSQASHSNQYDYIEVEPNRESRSSSSSRQPPGQQQLFSNILLSSPNHQVLLYQNGLALPYAGARQH